jgi:hypothetical protein
MVSEVGRIVGGAADLEGKIKGSVLATVCSGWLLDIQVRCAGGGRAPETGVQGESWLPVHTGASAYRQHLKS